MYRWKVPVWGVKVLHVSLWPLDVSWPDFAPVLPSILAMRHIAQNTAVLSEPLANTALVFEFVPMWLTSFVKN